MIFAERHPFVVETPAGPVRFSNEYTAARTAEHYRVGFTDGETIWQPWECRSVIDRAPAVREKAAWIA